MDHFVIPDIYCPFPLLTSPYLEQVQTHAQEWFQDWLKAICPVSQGTTQFFFLTSEVPRLVCSIYPSAGPEELFLCSDWFSWGFTYDDVCDNSGLAMQPYELSQIHAGLLAVFQASSATSVQEPMAAALSDIWQRARQLTSATWQQRFARHHADFFAGQRQEAANRLRQQIPDMQAYIINRRSTAASMPCADLIELVQHIEIPVEIYESQPFQTILNSMYDLVAWTNDVYALPKELAHGEVNNLIVIMRHEDGGSLQDAINRACTLINRETRRFEELVQSLPSYPVEVDRVIRSYLVDVGHYIRAALDYERTGSRYQAEEGNILSQHAWPRVYEKHFVKNELS